jgi:hypothetical protein
MKPTLLPSHFTRPPFDSVVQDEPCEATARNIMIILSSTGNKWRKLSFAEFKKKRLKDGNWSDIEQQCFDKVIDYCRSAEKAESFSPVWRWHPEFKDKGEFPVKMKLQIPKKEN